MLQSPMFRSSLLLLALASVLSAAEPVIAPNGPTYPPPRSAPVSFQLRTTTLESDGFFITLIEMTAPGIRLTLAPRQDWLPERLPNSSAGFRHRYQPEVQWSLSLRPYEGFLPRIDAEALAGYVRGLRLVHGNRLRWLPTDEGFTFQELRGAVLYTQPLVVRYQVEQPKPADAEPDSPPPPPIEYWDFFIEFSESACLVARFQAPVPLAAHAFPLFEEMLTSLDRP